MIDLPTVRRVGAVSDTHDWVHPRLLETLDGVDLILHGGDVCSRAVIDALESVAPVVAVRGNNDEGGECGDLPVQVSGCVGPVRIWMTHIVTLPTLQRSTPIPQGTDVVVYGHSHVPDEAVHNGIIYFNPGSAGKARFKSIPTCGVWSFLNGAFVRKTVVL